MQSCAKRSAAPVLILAPHHFVHNTGVGLDDLNHLGRYVFLHIIGNGDSVIAIQIHLHSGIHRLQQVTFVNAGNGWPTEVKKLDSSGRVPESETTQKAFICRQL